MEKTIQRTVNLYTLGLITGDEMAAIIAGQYARLWARGQLLEVIKNDKKV